MKIHEYQGKEIVRAYNVPVLRGHVASSPQEARQVAETLGGNRWVVKAQIHAGGRGKGGGVQVAAYCGGGTDRRYTAGTEAGHTADRARRPARAARVDRIGLRYCPGIVLWDRDRPAARATSVYGESGWGDGH